MDFISWSKSPVFFPRSKRSPCLPHTTVMLLSKGKETKGATVRLSVSHVVSRGFRSFVTLFYIGLSCTRYTDVKVRRSCATVDSTLMLSGHVVFARRLSTRCAPWPKEKGLWSCRPCTLPFNMSHRRFSFTNESQRLSCLEKGKNVTSIEFQGIPS